MEKVKTMGNRSYSLFMQIIETADLKSQIILGTSLGEIYEDDDLAAVFLPYFAAVHLGGVAIHIKDLNDQGHFFDMSDVYDMLNDEENLHTSYEVAIETIMEKISCFVMKQDFVEALSDDYKWRMLEQAEAYLEEAKQEVQLEAIKRYQRDRLFEGVDTSTIFSLGGPMPKA